jgi:hypothetical protein
VRAAIKNGFCWALAFIVGVVLLVPALLIVFAIFRFCYDVVTHRGNIFDGESRWRVGE